MDTFIELIICLAKATIVSVGIVVVIIGGVFTFVDWWADDNRWWWK